MVVSLLREIVCCWNFFTPVDGSLVIMEGSSLLRFCYSNGWKPCHYGRKFVVEIWWLQWMVALSLWKIVRYWAFVTLMNGNLVIMGDSSLLRFVTPMNGSLVFMGDSSLLRLVLQLMVVLLLWEIVFCWHFLSDGW